MSDKDPAVVPDVEDGPITVPIESAGYPAHYRRGWRDAMAAIRAEGRGALDVDVRTLIETTSPYRNCQYGHAFRAPCPDVGHNTESWCRFCQAHARLTALAQREPAESQGPAMSEPCPYCHGAGCLPCHGRGTVGPHFRSNRGLPPYVAESQGPDGGSPDDSKALGFMREPW